MYESQTNKFPGITWKLVFVTCVVSLGTQAPVYTLIVGNNLYSAIKTWYNTTNNGTQPIDSNYDWVWSAVNGAVPFGAILGSLMIKFVADSNFSGRKKGLLLQGLISAVGIAVSTISAAYHVLWLVFMGRIICGLAAGIGAGVGGLFLNEIAPPKFRGSVCSVQQVSASLINVVALTVTIPLVFGSPEQWWIAFLIPLVPAIMQLVAMTIAYDSPRHLVFTKAGPDISDKATEFYQGKSRIAAVKRELNLEISREIEDLRIGDLLRKASLRRPLILSICLQLGAAFSGGYVFLVYSQLIFLQVGLSASWASYSTVGLGVSTLVLPIAMVFLVEKFGRRPFLLMGLIGSLLPLSAMVILFCGLKYSNWPVACEFAFIGCSYFMMISSSMIHSVAWVIPAELFPQGVRSSAMTIITFFDYLFKCIQIFFFIPLGDLIGFQFIFLPNIILILFPLTILAVYLPETKGQTVLEISKGFSPKFHSRKISVVYNFNPRNISHRGYQSDTNELAKREREPISKHKTSYGSVSVDPGHRRPSTPGYLTTKLP